MMKTDKQFTFLFFAILALATLFGFHVIDAHGQASEEIRYVPNTIENQQSLYAMQKLAEKFQNVTLTHPSSHAEQENIQFMANRTKDNIEYRQAINKAEIEYGEAGGYSTEYLEVLRDTKERLIIKMNQTQAYYDGVTDYLNNLNHEMVPQCINIIKDVLRNRTSPENAMIVMSLAELQKLKECIEFMKEHIDRQHHVNIEELEMWSTHKVKYGDKVTVHPKDRYPRINVDDLIEKWAERLSRSVDQKKTLEGLDKKVDGWIHVRYTIEQLEEYQRQQQLHEELERQSKQ